MKSRKLIIRDAEENGAKKRGRTNRRGDKKIRLCGIFRKLRNRKIIIVKKNTFEILRKQKEANIEMLYASSQRLKYDNIQVNYLVYLGK